MRKLGHKINKTWRLKAVFLYLFGKKRGEKDITLKFEKRKEETAIKWKTDLSKLLTLFFYRCIFILHENNL